MPPTTITIEVPADLPPDTIKYLEENLAGIVNDVLEARRKGIGTTHADSYRALVELFAGDDLKLRRFDPGSIR